MPREWRALAKVAVTSIALAPAAAVARVSGAATRAWLEWSDAKAALSALGITEEVRAIARLGGGRSNAVYRVELATRTIVLKRALAEGTVLALGARLAGPQPYARDVSAPARVAREAHALTVLARAGVRVPALVAADPARGLLALEFVEGTPLPQLLARAGAKVLVERYAELLAAVHAAGIALADAHPGNVLVTAAGELLLLDLEFARTAAELGVRFAATCAFDRAYAAAYFTPTERAWFASADSDVRIDELALLFMLERRRQRRVG